MTAPTLLELAKVAGTVEDVIVAEIVEDGGELNCADGEEESHIIYQLASEVMVHRAAALSEADRELLLALRDIGRAVNQDEVSEAWSRHSGDKVERAIAVLDRLLGRSAT